MKTRMIVLCIALIFAVVPIVMGYDSGEVHCTYDDGIMVFFCSDNNVWFTYDTQPTAEMISYYSAQVPPKEIPVPDTNPVTFVEGGQTGTLSGT